MGKYFVDISSNIYRKEKIMTNTLYVDDVLSTYVGIAVASGNDLILATQSGIITGKPVMEDDELLPIQETFFKLMDEERKSKKEEFAQSITLRDVKISSGNATYNLLYLTVFVDKILGVSIGKVDN